MSFDGNEVLRYHHQVALKKKPTDTTKVFALFINTLFFLFIFYIKKKIQ